MAPRGGIVSWPYLAGRLRPHPRLDLMLVPVTPRTGLSVRLYGFRETGMLAPSVERGSCDGKLMAHLLFRYEAHLNTPICRGSIRLPPRFRRGPWITLK